MESRELTNLGSSTKSSKMLKKGDVVLWKCDGEKKFFIVIEERTDWLKKMNIVLNVSGQITTINLFPEFWSSNGQWFIL